MAIEKVKPIKFDERPATSLEIASEQLEHLYVHQEKTDEKLNELIDQYNKRFPGPKV